jgi:hypothetical protein
MSAKGGITDGASHKEGGIPMVVKSTGQHVELEGGEGVINKRNMASEKTYDFEGKELTICEIASEINSKDGNGVQIDCDDITGKKYKYGEGGVIFIPYKEKEIMYEPNFNKYYANDEEFDTLEEAQKFIDSGETPDHIREAYRKGLFKDGGMVRTLYVGDAVLYKGDTWYLSVKNSQIGIKSLRQGAWGSDYPFIPLSKIDVDTQLTDMGGNRINIFHETEKTLKDRFSREYDEMLKKDSPDTIAEKYDLDMREGRSDEEMKEDFVNWRYRVYPYKYAHGGKTENAIKTDDYDTATSMSLGGVDIDEATAVTINEGFERGGEVSKGTRHEMEHKETIDKFKRAGVSTKEVAKSIAKDHLKEDKNYYKKLDILEKSTLAEMLSTHKQHKKKNNGIKKYAIGGSVYQRQNTHPVHIVFTENYLAPLYDENGRYDGDVIFKKDVVNQMEFVKNNGKKSHFRFVNTDKYVIVPNEVVVITGYNKHFAQGGEVPPAYNRYSDLSESDKHILDILRDDISGFVRENNTSWSINQKVMFSNFRGYNIANELSEAIINKLYAILFKEHSLEHPIENLYLSNVGAGNILNYAPIYLKNIIVSNDETPFEQIEDKICRIVNMDSYTKKWNDYNVSDYENTDAMIHCFSRPNPTSDVLLNDMNEHEKMRIGVAICEFYSTYEMNEYVDRLNMDAYSFKMKLSVYKINEPITLKGKCTLIYVLKR